MQAATQQHDFFEQFADISFNQNDVLLEAIETFRTFEKESFLIYGDFEDDIWKVVQNKRIERLCSLNFEGVISPQMKLMLKAWVINHLEKKLPTTVQEALTVLKKVIIFTSEFKLEHVESFVDWIEAEIPISQRRIAVGSLLNFLDYTQLAVSEEYYNELALGTRKLSYEGSFRDLPNYEDVLMFQYIMNHFIGTWSEKEKICFYPIVLWWKITSIIPMRIEEFCSITRNCLKIENGNYYIVLPRKKQKATRKTQVEVFDTLEIDEDTFSRVSEYISLTEECGMSHSLLSYPAYKQFVGTDNFNNTSTQFTQANFRRLLDKYYNEIIIEKYKTNDLNKIKPNDTRHFAFCSMMLQGFDALTIARMGGHRSVESQYHYQQHLSYFTQSSVYHLAKINKLRNSKVFRSEGSVLLLEEAKSNSLRPINSIEYLEPMEIGYCTDPEMECESDYCQLCSKWYIPFNDLKNHHKELLDFSESRKRRIEERLKTMELLRQQLEPENNEHLLRESKLIRGDIEDMAKIQSYIEENGEENHE